MRNRSSCVYGSWGGAITRRDREKRKSSTCKVLLLKRRLLGRRSGYPSYKRPPYIRKIQVRLHCCNQALLSAALLTRQHPIFIIFLLLLQQGKIDNNLYSKNKNKCVTHFIALGVRLNAVSKYLTVMLNSFFLFTISM